MIELEINTDDLLKWSRYMNEIPKRTPAAIARGLNRFGVNVKAAMMDYLAAETGLSSEQINSVTSVEEASAGSLRWAMDASRALLNDADEWRRPWVNSADHTFQQEILLNIVTQPNACDICTTAASHSPYTAEEISNMAATWANFVPAAAAIQNAPVTNLLHPNCHCVTTSWDVTRRRLPIVFGGVEQMMTTDEIGRELGRIVLDELEGEIAAILV